MAAKPLPEFWPVFHGQTQQLANYRQGERSRKMFHQISPSISSQNRLKFLQMFISQSIRFCSDIVSILRSVNARSTSNRKRRCLSPSAPSMLLVTLKKERGRIHCIGMKLFSPGVFLDREQSLRCFSRLHFTVR